LAQKPRTIIIKDCHGPEALVAGCSAVAPSKATHDSCQGANKLGSTDRLNPRAKSELDLFVNALGFANLELIACSALLGWRGNAAFLPCWSLEHLPTQQLDMEFWNFCIFGESIMLTTGCVIGELFWGLGCVEPKAE
jgi:hypothetical protein